MAGARNKCPEVWKFISECDIVGMIETWVDEKGWNQMKKYLPKEFNWKCEPATREKKKGRAIGGIITGIRKEIKEEESAINSKNVMERKVIINEETWRIFTVYCKGNEDIKSLNKLIEETEEGNLLVGGDFNARTGREGGIIDISKKDRYTRKSKDKMINREGRTLLQEISERGCMILNGCEEVQEHGELTYIGEQGSSIIDYVIANSEACCKVKNLKVENRSESDHLPLVAMIEGEIEKREMNEKVTTIKMSDWSTEGIEHFHNNMKEWKNDKMEKNAIWKEMKDQINKAKKVIVKNKRI